MNYFALILIVYYVVYLGINMVNHGESYSITPGKLFLSQLFTYSMLACGGLFAVWGWPEIVIISMSAMAWGAFIGNGFEPIKSKYNVVAYIIVATLVWFLFWCGGFWFF